MSSLPGVSSPELQAALYVRKFFGNSSLNCNAISLPITPTVLTVFTRVSALEVIILPLVKCIMDRSIFVCYLCILGCLFTTHAVVVIFGIVPVLHAYHIQIKLCQIIFVVVEPCQVILGMSICKTPLWTVFYNARYSAHNINQIFLR